jgi:hypothetical protein
MKHTGVEERLYTTEARPPAAVAVGVAQYPQVVSRVKRHGPLFFCTSCHNNEMSHLPRSLKFEASSVKYAKQTQSGGARPGSQGAIAQNEPNLAGRPGLQRPNCAKQSQTWAGWDIWGTTHQGGQSCETKPIPGGPGWDGAAGAWDTGQMCKTNPIRESGPVQAGGRSCETKPIWPRLGRTLTGERCETKPILPARPGMGAGGRGREEPRGPIVRNEAKFEQDGTSEGRRVGEANCAKRSQFWQESPVRGVKRLRTTKQLRWRGDSGRMEDRRAGPGAGAAERISDSMGRTPEGEASRSGAAAFGGFGVST